MSLERSFGSMSPSAPPLALLPLSEEGLASYEVALRVDAENVLNTPQWGTPDTEINSLDFGRITSAAGNRIIVLTGRINF